MTIRSSGEALFEAIAASVGCGHRPERRPNDPPASGTGLRQRPRADRDDQRPPAARGEAEELQGSARLRLRRSRARGVDAARRFALQPRSPLPTGARGDLHGDPRPEQAGGLLTDSGAARTLSAMTPDRIWGWAWRHERCGSLR